MDIAHQQPNLTIDTTPSPVYSYIEFDLSFIISDPKIQKSQRFSAQPAYFFERHINQPIQKFS